MRNKGWCNRINWWPFTYHIMNVCIPPPPDLVSGCYAPSSLEHGCKNRSSGLGRVNNDGGRLATGGMNQYPVHIPYQYSVHIPYNQYSVHIPYNQYPVHNSFNCYSYICWWWYPPLVIKVDIASSRMRPNDEVSIGLRLFALVAWGEDCSYSRTKRATSRCWGSPTWWNRSIRTTSEVARVKMITGTILVSCGNDRPVSGGLWKGTVFISILPFPLEIAYTPTSQQRGHETTNRFGSLIAVNVWVHDCCGASRTRGAVVHDCRGVVLWGWKRDRLGCCGGEREIDWSWYRLLGPCQSNNEKIIYYIQSKNSFLWHSVP